MGTIKDDIEVYDPVNTNKNIYYSKVMYKNAELTLQLSKNKMNLNKEKNKAKLNVDEETVKFIKEVSKAVVEITSNKSMRFFGKEINVEDCESIYKEALVDDTLHCFYDEEQLCVPRCLVGRRRRCPYGHSQVLFRVWQNNIPRTSHIRRHLRVSTPILLKKQQHSRQSRRVRLEREKQCRFYGLQRDRRSSSLRI